jgi:polygalacturonase
MFAQFDLVISMRRNARALFALMVLSVFAPAAVLKAQDTRTVVEPTFPATCTALAAQQAIVSGEPASETTLDTTRIQTALTACPSGQAVELTLGGTNNVNTAFLTGPLNIPSGVTLVVDGGVTLFASRNPADYQSTATGAETCGTVGTAGNGCVPLIQINNGSASTGSGVMGYGVINGRGGDKLLKGGVTQKSSWWDLANQANGNGAQNNPILLYAKNAANFTIYKISLINAPFFHVKYQTASGFTVWGVKIVTPYTSRNTDGIDPTDKITNVTINNSYISDGDDNVALGASGTGNGVSNVS